MVGSAVRRAHVLAAVSEQHMACSVLAVNSSGRSARCEPKISESLAALLLLPACTVHCI
jgi:hypothetical protein